MNRAALLKRLEALEAAVSPTPVQWLAFVDVTTLPDDVRDAYWRGDGSVIDAYTDPDTRSIIVDLNPASRASWLATRGMTEEQIEVQENDLDRAEAAERIAIPPPAPAVTESEGRPPAVWGYDRFGNPVFDNDLKAGG